MSSLSNLVIADRFLRAENPDWQSVIVTERLQLAADMMRADAKRPLDRARNGLGPPTKPAGAASRARQLDGEPLLKKKKKKKKGGFLAVLIFPINA